MKYQKNGIITNSFAVKQIAEEFGFETKMINQTIKGIFSFKGVKQLVKKGVVVKIKNLGTFKPDAKRQIIQKRKIRSNRTTERIKKRNYLNSKKKMKTKESTGTVRELVKPGLHPATIISLIDLGTQRSNNPAYPDKRKIMITYELKGKDDYRTFQKEKGPQPFIMSEEHSIIIDAEGFISIHYTKSNLGKRIIEFLGEEVMTVEKRNNFDLKDLLGKNGQILVEHKINAKKVKRDNIKSAIPKDEGAVYNKTHNPFVLFSIGSDECLYNDLLNKDKVSGADKLVLPKLQRWIIKKIIASPEWVDAHGSFGSQFLVDKNQSQTENEFDESEYVSSPDEESPF